MGLSAEQERAVTRTGQDVCCVAGPGSGKTRVLVARFAWLVERGSDPRSILAVTFTEKAAREVKTRLVEHFSRQENKRRAVERAPVSTIHSFCNSLLGANALRAGLDPSFRVMDEREAALERYAVMDAVLDSYAADHPRRLNQLLDAWTAHELPPPLLAVYEKLRMHGGPSAALALSAVADPGPALAALVCEAEEFLRHCPPSSTPAQNARISAMRDWLSSWHTEDPWLWLKRFPTQIRGFRQGHPFRDFVRRAAVSIEGIAPLLVSARYREEAGLLREILLAFGDAYARRKRSLASLDFEDLQEHALRLLSGDRTVREEMRQQFDAILMDELQDTNPVQWQIIDLLRRPGRFFAVGDINQSIFGFRLAEPAIFAAYRAQVAAQGEVDVLSRNYRSRPEILEAVNRLTPHCPGLEPHTLVWRDAQAPAAEPRVELMRIVGDDPLEASWIARRVRELHASASVPHASGVRSARFNDFAILCRTAAPFDDLERALAAEGVPCAVKRGRNLLEEQECLDLSNWLRVLDNPCDQVSLVALLRSPFFGLADEEILRSRLAGNSGPAQALSQIQACRRMRAEILPDRVLAAICDQTGYFAGLSPSRRANAGKFLRILRETQSSVEGGLPEWIRRMEELRRAGSENIPAPPGAEDAVEILTIHSAKGLEFPFVFLASIHRKTGGTPGSLDWHQDSGLGARWRMPSASTGQPDAACRAVRAGQEQLERLEEDRLLYVALTRAEERVIVSWRDVGPQHRSPWPDRLESALNPKWPSAPGSVLEQGFLRTVLHDSPPPRLPPLSASAPDSGALEIAPIEPAFPPPGIVSATALSHFHGCPRKYFLSSLLRWPEWRRSGESGGAMEFGAEVHELLAGIRLAAPSAAAAELVQAFHASPLGARAASAARVEHEFDALAELNGILLQGSIDLWFEEGDGRVVLVDYKTDRLWSADRESVYSTQLRLYALILRKLLGRPPHEAWLFRLRDAQAIAVDVTHPALQSAERVIAEFAATAAAGEFDARPGSQCAWCAYAAGACPEPRPAPPESLTA